MKSLKVSLFVLLFVVLISSAVIAAPPFQTSSNSISGFEITYPKLENIKAGQSIQLHFHVYNITNGVLLTNSSVSCLFHLYNSTSDHIIQNSSIHFNTNKVDFEVDIAGGLIQTPGDYSYLVACNNSVSGGYNSIPLKVTSTGYSFGENNSLWIILVIVAFVFLMIYIYTNQHLFGVLCGFTFLVAGVFVMINGIGGLTDLYTRSIAFVFLGLGMIFTVASAFNWANHSDEAE